MDSNNFAGNTGVGEREARIYSYLVARRNYNLGHGIGRSGDVNALQPKAVGSSLMVKLTKAMTLHVLRKVIGLHFINDVLILPSATGMSITLSLLALKALKSEAEYVIWPRIDQKTCLKSILTANLKPIWIEPSLKGEELNTNLEGIEKAIAEYKDKVLCVITTTSCFAPRAYDNVVEVAEICKKNSLFHMVNNAYGL
jgi:O-phospho-L-seryl-tRNASec:L-selenocysteinyl-tRNA synthase